MTRLAAIEAREKAAPKGPWEAGYTGSGDWALGKLDDPEERVASVYTRRDDAPAVMAFVAHARQDIPWLLARVQQLESALRARVAYLAVHGDNLHDVSAALAALNEPEATEPT